MTEFSFLGELTQSDPLPWVYKIKHLAMQSAFTNICEKELSEFKSGTVIGCHLYNGIKGLVHPKMKIMSFITHSCVVTHP